MDSNENLERVYEKPAVVDYGDLLELTAGYFHPPIGPQGGPHIDPPGCSFSNCAT